jgi:hypothetical protein
LNPASDPRPHFRHVETRANGNHSMNGRPPANRRPPDPPAIRRARYLLGAGRLEQIEAEGLATIARGLRTGK